MINQEFSKVPQDICSPILKRNLIFQVGEDRSGIGTIHITLGEQNQSFPHSTMQPNASSDFWFLTRFLLQELVAWEGENLKALVSEFIDQIDKLCVICGCQTSF